MDNKSIEEMLEDIDDGLRDAYLRLVRIQEEAGKAIRNIEVSQNTVREVIRKIQ